MPRTKITPPKPSKYRLKPRAVTPKVVLRWMKTMAMKQIQAQTIDAAFLAKYNALRTECQRKGIGTHDMYADEFLRKICKCRKP
jgi:hypothetical protein